MKHSAFVSMRWHKLSVLKQMSGLLVLIACLWCTSPVLAAVCVIVDTAKDQLEPSDQQAVTLILAQTLRSEGQTVIAAPCDAMYRVYHASLGYRIHVFLTGPTGTRSGHAASLEDIPNVYSQLVRALLQSGSVVTRRNVTTDQVIQRRVSADSLWYVQLSPGLVIGGEHEEVSPTAGFGFRHELDRWGIDASLNFPLTDDNISASIVRLMGLHFFHPTANASLYAGVGLSWGFVSVTGDADEPTGEDLSWSVDSDQEEFSGEGLQGEIAVGYELLRASSIRMFTELRGTLPFYASESDRDSSSRYTPTVALSIGLGWGKRRSRIVYATY